MFLQRKEIEFSLMMLKINIKVMEDIIPKYFKYFEDVRHQFGNIIIKHCNSYSDGGYDAEGLPQSLISDFYIITKHIDISKYIISKLEKCLFNIFGNTFSPISLPDKRTSIKIQSTGQRHPLHSDSSKTTHSGYNYGENLAYSGILSMSDDYTGGEVNFPGDKAFTRLGAGDAIFFPSQKHIHQIEMVGSGKRFTFLTFWENCE